MIAQGITQESFITLMEAKLRANYTDEQKDLIKLFGEGPTFCFADPGTGKTYTAIGGLLNAELFKQIPGRNIYALSFTRLATGELAVRHEKACQSLGVANTIQFSTLHSLCLRILKENHSKLGMNMFNSGDRLSMENARSLIEGSLEEWGVAVPPNKIAKVVRACNALNSALIFDQDVVMSKMAYKECGVTYDIFDRIRGLLFSYSLLTETISVSDLLLYTVLLLTRYPEVSDAFKSQCKLMLVDEAQDLSLLQLRVISLLTDNPVLIGDMKQQIYAFNGACQEVVQEFFRLYPNATQTKLTQSFRCKNAIAEFATKIILPNKIGGDDYRGVGEGGSVTIARGIYENGLDIESLAQTLHDEFVNNLNRFTRSYLFLTRNNISQIPIIEELFKQSLPFRTNKYVPAYEVPIIKEMCELLNLCANPRNLQNVMALRYLIPEFRSYALKDHPYYKICSKTGASIFEVNYKFQDMMAGTAAMQTLAEVSEMMLSNATAGDLCNAMWRLYNEQYVRPNAWKLENKPEYYIQAVKTLMQKPYTKFIQDEVAKLNIIADSERYRRGIRCYTMHASKGLEADVVYIVDADDGLIPNTAMLKKMTDAQCDIDVARAIREERSLCYVACTRAKDELYIVHNDEAPTPIIMGLNPYSMYDAIYEANKSYGDDIAAFDQFARRYVM